MKIIFAHFRSYWWLRYMAYVFVISITLAVLAQVHRLGSNPNSVTKFVYQLFRDWAGAIGALLTLMIITVAFLAIMDNRHARQVDRKERLLNELIEWAEAICVFTATLIAIDTSNQSRIKTSVGEQLKQLNVLAAKGIRVNKIMQKSFPENSDLLLAIRKLSENIYNATTSLSRVTESEVISVDEWSKVAESDIVNLRDDATKLIDLTTCIYTELL